MPYVFERKAWVARSQPGNIVQDRFITVGAMAMRLPLYQGTHQVWDLFAVDRRLPASSDETDES